MNLLWVLMWGHSENSCELKFLTGWLNLGWAMVEPCLSRGWPNKKMLTIEVYGKTELFGVSWETNIEISLDLGAWDCRKYLPGEEVQILILFQSFLFCLVFKIIPDTRWLQRSYKYFSNRTKNPRQKRKQSNVILLSHDVNNVCWRHTALCGCLDAGDMRGILASAG